LGDELKEHAIVEAFDNEWKKRERDEVWVSIRETEGKMAVKDLGVHGSALLKLVLKK
jgi:hypothetical protein